MDNLVTKEWGEFKLDEEARVNFFQYVKWGEGEISLDIFEDVFEHLSTPEISALLDRLSWFQNEAQLVIKQAWVNEDADLLFYLECEQELLEEVEPEVIWSQEAVLDKMALSGAFLAVDQHEQVVITLDFSIGNEISDQILAVKFDADGKQLGIAHES
ncbi:DUF2004 domain-containing protein [Listeria costaricensis]|uniref:DUF2004 domain-containing protein n=1 Tax=Listeria costaricensis TaxID=2026604 RepID=UPI000C080F75|nr:DUF2004 domain-containing protein [Listeria costaricensis]